jgi:hypothetical protein
MDLTQKHFQSVFDRIVDEFKGVSAASTKIGLNGYQHVQRWRFQAVPLHHCPTIEWCSEGRLTCEQIRPDVIWVRKRDVRGWPNKLGRPLVFFEPKAVEDIAA